MSGEGGPGKILLLGAGRMGGAVLQGWSRTGAVDTRQVLICDPAPGEAAHAALRAGATLDPPDAALAEAKTVLLAVKPQVWRAAAARYAPLMAPDAVIVSVLVGVRAQVLSDGFAARAVGRVMPTTAVAIAKGAATIFSSSVQGRAAAHALFDPIATTVDLDDEGLMDAASAVSGSGPAYLYAFVEALEAAGAAAGLPEAAAQRLARATVAGAAALMGETGEEPSELRRQVTSPGGTTQAALNVLLPELQPLLARAIAANIARAEALARS